MLWDNKNINIERAIDKNPNIVLLGDLNENLLNDNLSNLKHVILINNLEKVIKEPTRITPNTTTLLDPTLIPKDLEFYKAGCAESEQNISDHKATYVYLKFDIILLTRSGFTIGEILTV